FHFKAIDHVQLAAPKGSEDITRKFFKDILGFTEVKKPETLQKQGGVWFTYGNCHIHVGVEDHFSAAKKALPAFEVEDIERLKKHLIANDIAITEDDRLPGANRFYLTDPFGNRIECLEWM